jgi:hypothetical protein
MLISVYMHVSDVSLRKTPLRGWTNTEKPGNKGRAGSKKPPFTVWVYPLDLGRLKALSTHWREKSDLPTREELVEWDLLHPWPLAAMEKQEGSSRHYREDLT